MRKSLILLLSCLLLGACGSTESHEEPDAGLQCQKGELAYRGSLAGEAVEGSIGLTGHALTNVCEDSLCSLRVYFEGGGRLEFEWEDTLPEDTPRAASGSLNLQVHEGPNVGNCSTNPASEMTLTGDGVRFVLRDLNEAPYCNGTPISGELEGCAVFAEQ